MGEEGIMVSKEQHDELCMGYAAMVLADAEAEITSDALTTLIEASKNEVEPYWPMLFSGLLSKEGKVMELLSNQGGAGAAPAAGAAAGGEEAAAEEEKNEEEEADLGGSMDMFGGEDY